MDGNNPTLLGRLRSCTNNTSDSKSKVVGSVEENSCGLDEIEEECCKDLHGLL